MRISILYDNQSYSDQFQSGWGFSCLADGRVLFDTGEAPDPLFQNMNRMNIDPQNIEAVVISHDHWDHTGGLWELLKQRNGLKVFSCPGFGDTFRERVKTLDGILIESADFQEIDSRISVTGEIPGKYKGIFMPEQALMIKTESGVLLITGCSHPGILTIAEKAKKCFPSIPITYILGGFHLMNENPKIVDFIISSLMKLGVLKVWPTHCTGENARIHFRKRFGKNSIAIGAGSHIEI